MIDSSLSLLPFFPTLGAAGALGVLWLILKTENNISI